MRLELNQKETQLSTAEYAMDQDGPLLLGLPWTINIMNYWINRKISVILLSGSPGAGR